MSFDSKVRVMRGIIWLNRALCLVGVVLVCAALTLGEWGVAGVMAVLVGFSLAAQGWFRSGPIGRDTDPKESEAVRARVLGTKKQGTGP